MKQYNSLAMWCHLSTFAGVVVPLGNFIAPLVIWLLKKDEDPLVDDQGKEALNFQISVFIYALISGILVLVLAGMLMLVVVGLFTIVQVIKASIAASEGIKYRYPLCIRFIK